MHNQGGRFRICVPFCWCRVQLGCCSPRTLPQQTASCGKQTPTLPSNRRRRPHLSLPLTCPSLLPKARVLARRPKGERWAVPVWGRNLATVNSARFLLWRFTAQERNQRRVPRLMKTCTRVVTLGRRVVFRTGCQGVCCRRSGGPRRWRRVRGGCHCGGRPLQGPADSRRWAWGKIALAVTPAQQGGVILSPPHRWGKVALFLRVSSNLMHHLKGHSLARDLQCLHLAWTTFHQI